LSSTPTFGISIGNNPVPLTAHALALELADTCLFSLMAEDHIVIKIPHDAEPSTGKIDVAKTSTKIDLAKTSTSKIDDDDGAKTSPTSKIDDDCKIDEIEEVLEEEGDGNQAALEDSPKVEESQKVEDSPKVIHFPFFFFYINEICYCDTHFFHWSDIHFKHIFFTKVTIIFIEKKVSKWRWFQILNVI
jgi:hypothetical protein